MGRVYGVDLGTTNSAISVYMGKNTSKIIELDNGYTTLPSCVMLSNGKLIAGRKAYENKYKPCSVYSVKSKMGTASKIHLVETLEDGKRSEVVLTPEEVSAEIIKELVRQANNRYKDIKDVTITVPAGFGESQRRATKKAGELAGLNVVSIINEPTSASLCYPLMESKKILVYDLGGGTFDVSVVDIENVRNSEADLSFPELGINISNARSSKRYMYNILANENDNHLGGDDLDREIYIRALTRTNTLRASIGRYHKIQDLIASEIKEYLIMQIEETKKSLTDAVGIIHIPIPNLYEFDEQVHLTFTTEDIVEATKVIYRRTVPLVQKALSDSRISQEEFKEIVLVGGSTKSAILRHILQSEFPDCNINSSMNPDESVAIGASIQTAITLNQSDTSVFDVVPQTISVETIGESLTGKRIPGKLVPLIAKNTVLPATVRQNFELAGTQKDIAVHLYQGSNLFKTPEDHIGDILLKRDNNEAKSVTLELLVNTQGMLEVSVMSGGFKTEVSLTNVLLGNESKTTKSRVVSPRSKLVDRWRVTLESSRKPGTKLPPTLEKALAEFEESGDLGAKKVIDRHLSKARLGDLQGVDMDKQIEKTSLFGNN